MEKYYKLLLVSLLVFVNSCGFNSKFVYFIDRHPYPMVGETHLTLDRWRGYYSKIGYSIYATDWVEYNQAKFNKENGSKKWIVANWGQPDSVAKNGSVLYYIYTAKSKDALDYRKQANFTGGPVKLGFRGDRLVEIQAYFSDRGYKGQKVVILNP